MWNLFKAQLIAEYSPTTYNFADLNKVGKHGRYAEQLYRTHFDITSGGRLLPRPDVPVVFEAVSLVYSSQNRFNINANSPLLSSQLRFDHTFYWTARIIDSPTAIIITLFPGIWTDIFFSPNFGFGARNWVDAVSMSMYLQKTTVIGIRISKLPPYLVTAWSGFCFKTFDSGLSAASILSSITSVVNAEISLMSAIVYQGNTSALDMFKDAYSQIFSSIITPNLINAANEIPSIFGSDFRGIDLTNQSSEATQKVLGIITGLCNQFISNYQNASQGGQFVPGEGRIIPNLTILVGVLGLEEEKKQWIESFRKGVAVVSYNDLRYPLAKEYYEKVRPGYRGPYQKRFPYDDEYAEYDFFTGEDLTYSYTSRRGGIGISFSDFIRYRDPLFQITIQKAEDIIYEYLISGTPVVFDARNLEKEDRDQLQANLQRRIETKIQSDFLDEFNLLIDGKYYNQSQWTEEQREEYRNRIQALLGVTFSMKIFDYKDLIPEDLEFDTELLELEYVKDILYNNIINNYDTEFLGGDDSTSIYKPSLIDSIINTQIRRFEDDRIQRENPNNYNRDNYTIILN